MVKNECPSLSSVSKKSFHITPRFRLPHPTLLNANKTPIVEYGSVKVRSFLEVLGLKVNGSKNIWKDQRTKISTKGKGMIYGVKCIAENTWKRLDVGKMEIYIYPRSGGFDAPIFLSSFFYGLCPTIEVIKFRHLRVPSWC